MRMTNHFFFFPSQGSELALQGRELANHFKTEGTPIMIGKCYGIERCQRTCDPVKACGFLMLNFISVRFHSI